MFGNFCTKFVTITWFWLELYKKILVTYENSISPSLVFIMDGDAILCEVRTQTEESLTI